jgi:integrase
MVTRRYIFLEQETPAATNHRVAYLRIMLDWAMEERSHWVKRNAAAGVKLLTCAKEGFTAGRSKEVRQFEKRHPVGSTARLAMALTLYTGMRRSDAVLLGPDHVKNGWIKFTQEGVGHDRQDPGAAPAQGSGRRDQCERDRRGDVPRDEPRH